MQDDWNPIPGPVKKQWLAIAACHYPTLNSCHENIESPCRFGRALLLFETETLITIKGF